MNKASARPKRTRGRTHDEIVDLCEEDDAVTLNKHGDVFRNISSNFYGATSSKSKSIALKASQKSSGSSNKDNLKSKCITSKTKGVTYRSGDVESTSLSKSVSVDSKTKTYRGVGGRREDLRCVIVIRGKRCELCPFVATHDEIIAQHWDLVHPQHDLYPAIEGSNPGQDKMTDAFIEEQSSTENEVEILDLPSSNFNGRSNSTLTTSMSSWPKTFHGQEGTAPRQVQLKGTIILKAFACKHCDFAATEREVFEFHLELEHRENFSRASTRPDLEILEETTIDSDDEEISIVEVKTRPSRKRRLELDFDKDEEERKRKRDPCGTSSPIEDGEERESKRAKTDKNSDDEERHEKDLERLMADSCKEGQTTEVDDEDGSDQIELILEISDVAEDIASPSQDRTIQHSDQTAEQTIVDDQQSEEKHENTDSSNKSNFERTDCERKIDSQEPKGENSNGINNTLENPKHDDRLEGSEDTTGEEHIREEGTAIEEIHDETSVVFQSGTTSDGPREVAENPKDAEQLEIPEVIGEFSSLEPEESLCRPAHGEQDDEVVGSVQLDSSTKGTNVEKDDSSTAATGDEKSSSKPEVITINEELNDEVCVIFEADSIPDSNKISLDHQRPVGQPDNPTDEDNTSRLGPEESASVGELEDEGYSPTDCNKISEVDPKPVEQPGYSNTTSVAGIYSSHELEAVTVIEEIDGLNDEEPVILLPELQADSNSSSLEDATPVEKPNISKVQSDEDQSSRLGSVEGATDDDVSITFQAGSLSDCYNISLENPKPGDQARNSKDKDNSSGLRPAEASKSVELCDETSLEHEKEPQLGHVERTENDDACVFIQSDFNTESGIKGDVKFDEDKSPNHEHEQTTSVEELNEEVSGKSQSCSLTDSDSKDLKHQKPVDQSRNSLISNDKDLSTTIETEECTRSEKTSDEASVNFQQDHADESSDKDLENPIPDDRVRSPLETIVQSDSTSGTETEEMSTIDEARDDLSSQDSLGRLRTDQEKILSLDAPCSGSSQVQDSSEEPDQLANETLEPAGTSFNQNRSSPTRQRQDAEDASGSDQVQDDNSADPRDFESGGKQDDATLKDAFQPESGLPEEEDLVIFTEEGSPTGVAQLTYETLKKSSSALPDPSVIDAMILDSLMLNDEADTSVESFKPPESPVIDPDLGSSGPSGSGSPSGSAENVLPPAACTPTGANTIGKTSRAIMTSPAASSSRTPVSKKKRKLSPDTRRQISIYDGYISAMKSSPMIQVTVDDGTEDDEDGVHDHQNQECLSSKKKKRRINPEATSDVDSILPFSSQKSTEGKRRINLASKFRL